MKFLYSPKKDQNRMIDSDEAAQVQMVKEFMRN